MKNVPHPNLSIASLKKHVLQQISRISLVFILLFGFYTEGSAQCTCTDCRCADSLELVKLYNATNGANWTIKWNLAQPITSWYGVTSGNGRVIRLDMVSNKLSGTIPNLNLPYLSYLSFYSNQLSGAIPNLKMPKLILLLLQFNQLSGCIPKEIKTNCPLITATGGGIASNPNLTTQSWANYWNNGEGACAPVAVATANLPENIRLYPNPVHDFLFIENTKNMDKAMIYNVLGSLVLSTQQFPIWLLERIV